MNLCSGDLHLRWISSLLRVLSLFSICSTSAKSSGAGIIDSETHHVLKGIQGSSVWFHVVKWPEADIGVKLEEISWGVGPVSNYRTILTVKNGSLAPTWVSLRDKYEHRIHVPNVTSLRIDNLTLCDSGYYLARGQLPEGRVFNQVFDLTVYAPVPHLQILTRSWNITPDWCNVTLECNASWATDNLNVTWDTKGLPMELQWREMPGPAFSLLSLEVSLPLSQPSVTLTCVASNPVDENNATSDLHDFCVQGIDSPGLLMYPSGGILWAFLALLLVLGAGLYFWRIQKKKRRRKKNKMDIGGDAGSQQDHRAGDDGISYAEVMNQESSEGKDEGFGGQHLGEEMRCVTIYSEVHKPGRALKII